MLVYPILIGGPFGGHALTFERDDEEGEINMYRRITAGPLAGHWLAHGYRPSGVMSNDAGKGQPNKEEYRYVGHTCLGPGTPLDVRTGRAP